MRVSFSCVFGLAVFLSAVAACSSDDGGGAASDGGVGTGAEGGRPVPTDGGSDVAKPPSSDGAVEAGPAPNDAGAPDAQVHVLPCTEADGGTLPVGVWQNITPSAIDVSADAGHLGTLSIETDPLNAGTIYTTGDHQGLFRSKDCGSTWTKINTGRNGPTLDTGSEFVLRIDPADSNVMYSSPLYGSDLSLFKSTNGGVDWDSVMPPGSTVAKALEYMFFQDLAIDPTDHQHLVATFHVNCVAPYSKMCMAESKDGGGTWRVFNGPPGLAGWVEDGGPVILNGTTFFFGAPFEGLFRTTDNGATWTQVAPQGYHRFYQSTGGWTYMGSAQNGIYRSQDPASADANRARWDVIPNTLTTVGGSIIGDGQRIFAAARQYTQAATSPESDGLAWTSFAPPSTADGATWFGYDAAHHLLYSTNTNAGLWRYVTH